VGAGKEGRREGGKEGSEFPIHLFESRAGREQDVQRRIEDRRTDTIRIPCYLSRSGKCGGSAIAVSFRGLEALEALEGLEALAVRYYVVCTRTVGWDLGSMRGRQT
jgi:hypothetical protein